MGIFHAYDVRGVYPAELNEEVAFRLGKALVTFFKEKEYVVGRDARLSSPKLMSALIQGITAQGGDVVNIGQCTTPEFNFVCAHYGYRAGVMVTASHNPKEYNGFKINGPHAWPIGYDTGLRKIEQLVKKKLPASHRLGSVRMHDYTTDYVHFLRRLVHMDLNKLYVIVDESNGTEGRICRHLFHDIGLKFKSINYAPRGDFPNHSPNPLLQGSSRQLEHEVIRRKVDLGLLFDADADRIVFLDEQGRNIQPNIIAALIVQYYAQKGDVIVYDATTSRIVPEIIQKKKAKGLQSSVGRSHLLHHMKKHKALFGAESSGHYFFKEVYGTDSGIMCALKVMQILAKTRKKLSALVKPLQKYAKSGDINIPLRNHGEKDKLMKKIERAFTGGRQSRLDGLTVEYKDWWFNLRASNTEPLLRLNVEANDWVTMEHKKEEIIRCLGG